MSRNGESSTVSGTGMPRAFHSSISWAVSTGLVRTVRATRVEGRVARA